MNLGLKGKVALVTGASDGLGRATAERLADEGAAVAICARGAARLKAVVEGIRERGGDVLDVVADVTRRRETSSGYYASLARDRGVPVGRIGEAAEVGALVAFLASDQAAYITGVAINFDGGLSGAV